jgi:hypothetical protein
MPKHKGKNKATKREHAQSMMLGDPAMLQMVHQFSPPQIVGQPMPQVSCQMMPTVAGDTFLPMHNIQMQLQLMGWAMPGTEVPVLGGLPVQALTWQNMLVPVVRA